MAHLENKDRWSWSRSWSSNSWQSGENSEGVQHAKSLGSQRSWSWNRKWSSQSWDSGEGSQDIQHRKHSGYGRSWSRSRSPTRHSEISSGQGQSSPSKPRPSSSPYGTEPHVDSNDAATSEEEEDQGAPLPKGNSFSQTCKVPFGSHVDMDGGGASKKARLSRDAPRTLPCPLPAPPPPPDRAGSLDDKSKGLDDEAALPFNLSDRSLDDEALQTFLEIDGPKLLQRARKLGGFAVEHVSVKGNTLTDKGIDLLVKFLIKNNLPARRLDLSGNQLNEPDSLCQLLDGEGPLQELHLVNTGIGELGLVAMFEQLLELRNSAGAQLKPPFCLVLHRKDVPASMNDFMIGFQEQDLRISMKAYSPNRPLHSDNEFDVCITVIHKDLAAQGGSNKAVPPHDPEIGSMRSFIVARDTPYIEAIRNSTKQRENDLRQLSLEEKAAELRERPIFWYSWPALVKAASDDESLDPNSRRALMHHYEKQQEDPVQAMNKRVGCVALRKTYHSNKCRLFVSVCEELQPLLDYISQGISAAGGKEKREDGDEGTNSDKTSYAVRKFSFPASSAHAEAAKEAGRCYEAARAASSQDKGNQHNFGKPHSFLWLALVETASSDAVLKPSERDALSEHHAEMVDKWDDLEKLVTVCSVGKTYDSDIKKLLIAAAPEVQHLVESVLESLIAAGGKEKFNLEDDKQAMKYAPAAVFTPEQKIGLPTESYYVQAAKEWGQKYARETDYKRKKFGRGKFHCGGAHQWLWIGLVEAAAKDYALDADERAVLLDHQRSIRSPESLGKRVDVCRLDKTFNSGTKKLVMSVRQDMADLLDLVVKGVMASGGVLK